MLLDAGVANLNTGSFGPLPRLVFDQVTTLRRRLAEEPMDFLVRQAPPLLWEARTQLASFLGGDPRRLVFTANVTASVNTVAAALRLSAPGEILLTDHEYGAMHWCWERAAQRQGLSLRIVALPQMPASSQEIVDAVAGAFSEQTRLLFFSHVLSPTGMVLPARELCKEARRRGILTMIDGAHAPAMIPLDLSLVGSDFYGGNCHKWLHDAKSVDDRDEFGSTPLIRSFEFEGTRDLSPWLTIPSAISFQEALGWANIRARVAELTDYLRRRVLGEIGLALATPTNTSLHGFLTAFRLPKPTDVARLRRELWQTYRIEAPVIERPDATLLRVSLHFYNTEEEIDRLVGALQALLATP
jgi:isopenicillin-N epimerase